MLTDTECRKAKPRDRDYKLSDAQGPYLFVTKAGGKSWRMKYRYAGKEKRLTFGPYPEVTLLEAREKRDAARRLLRDGQDPAVVKKQRAALLHTNSAATFESFARRWHTLQLGRWTPHHAEDVLHSLVSWVFPDIGRMPLAAITVPLVLQTLRKIEDRGAIETAKRARQRISAIFVLAISEGAADTDPAALVGKALKPLKSMNGLG